MTEQVVARSVLKAVILDVDGTLYHQPPLRRAMAARLAKAHVLRPRRGLRTVRAISAFRAAQEELRHAPASTDLHTEQLSLAAARANIDAEEVARHVTRWMDDGPIDLVARYARPGLLDTLQQMRAQGLRLAVLSDYPATAKLQALGILEMIDVVVSAQDPEVGVFKPHPRGLEVVLDRLGLDGTQALYVGDRVDVDSGAASAAKVACIILAPQRAGDPEAGYRRATSFPEILSLLEGS